MRILLVTQLFQPEPNLLKGLQFARELQRRGHHVQVLTGLPNYPGGKLYPGYKFRFLMRETIDGVEVIRVGHFLSHDRSGLRRFFCYMSFAFAAALLGTFLVKYPDVIHVYQGPATLMIPAYAISIFRGGRIVLDIQDLWPESVTESGMLKFPGGAQLLKTYCDWAHRCADQIIVLSKGFKEQLIRRGIPANKVRIIYNWCEETTSSNPDSNQEPMVKDLLDRKYFNVVYAGSFGRMQCLDTVLDAASLFNNTFPSIHFVLIGDGIELPALSEKARHLALPNVTFLPRQPTEVVKVLLTKADALLIHLKDDTLSMGAIPQKTQAYLAAGRPIIIGVNGEAADLVEWADAGIRFRSGDASDLVEAVSKIAFLAESEREAMGRRGRAFYERELSFSRGCDEVEALFIKSHGALI